MTNEERLEEIIYQAHQRGDNDILHSYVDIYRKQHPNLRLIDYYDMAHTQIKKELGIIK
jgi:hypothetical protein